jgi:undecaprenyl-diphosphatase
MSDMEQVVDLIEDMAKLALTIAFLFLAVQFYLKHRQSSWSDYFARRRIIVLLAIVLTVLGLKVFEDVLGKESAPIDEAVLRFIHEHLPAALAGFFELITQTGSFRFLFPAAATVTIVLLLFRKRFEALLVAASTAGGGILIYLIKVAVDRARPSLWETKEYWGTSFPSGHTLDTAAFATAIALVASRIWPGSHHAFAAVATVWVLLVAFSRLALGVHWPTDVLAAVCLGALIPLLIVLIVGPRLR